MTDDRILNYVNAAAAMLGVPLDDARAGRVAGHLQRSAAMAALLDDVVMAADDEIAEIYSLIAFLPNKDGRKQL